MKQFFKLPLYLGLFVFIVAVLFASLKLGEKTSLTYNQTKASVAGALLSLKFTQPNSISILLNSDKEIAGIDVVLQYDKTKVRILPSSLKGVSNVIVSGGVLDEAKNTFSFSLLPKAVTKAGILASFEVVPYGNLKSVSSEIQIVLGTNGSTVLDKTSLTNILTTSDKVLFDLTAK